MRLYHLKYYIRFKQMCFIAAPAAAAASAAAAAAAAAAVVVIMTKTSITKLIKVILITSIAPTSFESELRGASNVPTYITFFFILL